MFKSVSQSGSSFADHTLTPLGPIRLLNAFFWRTISTIFLTFVYFQGPGKWTEKAHLLKSGVTEQVSAAVAYCFADILIAFIRCLPVLAGT